MCGIAGIIRFDQQQVSADDLQIMLQSLSHRGRDHAGIALGCKNDPKAEITQSADIGLGHRRLSIIDLDHSASQPMFYANKNLCITYNGEIFNYREIKDFLITKSYTFLTHADTEVLLAAYHYWGKDCLHHLNGMFAFAIWDEQRKELFCARDHLGIKPFYFYHTKNFFAFASESTALLHLTDKKLNHDALSAYFLSMYVPGKLSIFSRIEKLLPGHTLTINLAQTLSIKTFWSIDEFEVHRAGKDTLESLHVNIRQAVHRQLQSDVPIGGFLSGGIDSGLITALAVEKTSKYHTYSIGYDGFPGSELPYANQLASRLGTKHTAVNIEPQQVMNKLDQALYRMSEPIADPAIVATFILSEMAASDGVKVLLNGTGGDEVFSGYTRYTGQLSAKRKLMLAMPQLLKNLLAYLPLNKKNKIRLKHPAYDMIMSTGGSYFLSSQIVRDHHLFYNFLIEVIAASLPEKNQKSIPLLYQQMLFDLRVYLPDELLFLLDQMTMAHTIEGRVPLLDINVIRKAFGFFAHEHIENNQTKVLLKKIAGHYLGREHIQRKKQGFSIPTLGWVRANHSRFIETIVDLKKIDGFEKINIDHLAQFSNINLNNANHIFMLYCFAKWHKRIKQCYI